MRFALTTAPRRLKNNGNSPPLISKKLEGGEHMEDILNDPRYDDIDTLAQSGVIVEAVERCNKIFKTRTSGEWRDILSKNSISCEVMGALSISRKLKWDSPPSLRSWAAPMEYIRRLKGMLDSEA